MLARAKGCDILKLKVTHGCRYVPVANRIAFVIFDTAPMFLDSKLNLMVPDCSHPPAHVENKGSGKAIPGQCTSVLKVERKTLCPCIVVFLSLFLCQIQESSKNLVRTWLNTFWAPTGRAVDQSYQLCRLFQPAVVVAEGEAGGEIDQNGELRGKISPCAFVPVSTCRGTCFRAEFLLKLIMKTW